jgi:NADH dehydrogenase FAD-containing subunit
MLRNQALGMLELASLTVDPSARRAMLTFVVAGGGFAGVETLGALNDFVREEIGYYPALSEAELRLVLVHPNSVILPELNESLGRYAQAELASRKVEIRTDACVSAFSDEGAELSNSETLRTHTLVWTAGVKPPEVLQTLPIKNRITLLYFDGSGTRVCAKGLDQDCFAWPKTDEPGALRILAEELRPRGGWHVQLRAPPRRAPQRNGPRSCPLCL